jgi:hypothetical protein
MQRKCRGWMAAAAAGCLVFGGGAFGQEKDWGDVSPGEQGHHWPADLTYAGDRFQRTFGFVVGEEENGLGTWVTMKRYLAHSQTETTVAVWPLRETPGQHRGVGMASIVHEPPYSPPIIDTFALAEVINPGARIRTVTVAFIEDADGGMSVNWTQEFDRISDEDEDTLPVVIRAVHGAVHGLVAVLACIQSPTAQEVAYGVNVYNADNGTILMRCRIPAASGWNNPRDMVLTPTKLFITGESKAPDGRSVIRTVGLETETGVFLPGWASGDPHTEISIPDRHCWPARMIHARGSHHLVVTGHTKPVQGTDPTNALTFCYESEAVPPSPGLPPEVVVRWLDHYDSGAFDKPLDLAANNWNEDLPGNVSLEKDKVWVVGIRRTVNVGSQMQLFQYDNLEPFAPGNPYPLAKRDWNDRDARWPLEPTAGSDAEGYKIVVLRTHYPNGFAGKGVIVAGRVQRDATPNLWDFALWEYTSEEPPPLPATKERNWFVKDANIGTGENNRPEGLDARIIAMDGDPNITHRKIWFTGATQMLGGWQWYTAQWRY